MSTASAPAAAIRFGRGATPNRSASGTAARQPQLSAQLSVRDRQRHHLLTQWVEQLRDQGDAGGVHAAKVHHNGSRTTFEIIFDDGRRRASPGDPGTAAPQLGTPPSMPAPHRQAFSNPQKKPTARERVRAGGDGRPPAAAANPQRQMEYDPEMLPAEDPFLRWVTHGQVAQLTLFRLLFSQLLVVVCLTPQPDCALWRYGRFLGPPKVDSGWRRVATSSTRSSSWTRGG